jgi:hypothetical protein
VTPFSSQELFHTDEDKKNKCPKQIRYYREDGKWDYDVDFSEGGGLKCDNEDRKYFPHKHKWTYINGIPQHGDHIQDVPDILKNWKCKDYDFKNHKPDGCKKIRPMGYTG